MEKVLLALIIAMLTANGQSLTKEQAVCLYQGDFWDGSAIEILDDTIEISDGYLFINKCLVPELAPVDSAKDTTHAYVATQCIIKKWSKEKGSWIVDWYRNEVRFDVKGKTYKTIKLDITGEFGTEVKGKYIIIFQGDKDLYRINSKNGKYKKLSK